MGERRCAGLLLLVRSGREPDVVRDPRFDGGAAVINETEEGMQPN
jgi:hypothetical protein